MSVPLFSSCDRLRERVLSFDTVPVRVSSSDTVCVRKNFILVEAVDVYGTGTSATRPPYSQKYAVMEGLFQAKSFHWELESACA